MSEYHRKYIFGSVEYIKIQKGIVGNQKMSGKLKDPRKFDFVKKYNNCPRKPRNLDLGDSKNAGIVSSFNSSQNSTVAPPKKREVKKEPTITCHYCRGCYHLECMMDCPKWGV